MDAREPEYETSLAVETAILPNFRRINSPFQDMIDQPAIEQTDDELDYRGYRVIRYDYTDEEVMKDPVITLAG